MLFISVRSSDPNQVPRVLQVVEETKRLRYKVGMCPRSMSEGYASTYVPHAGALDLHQYVVYDNKEAMPQKGPRIINLDDNHGKNKTKEYTPPRSLTVHLSKIDMPELRPRGTLPDRQPTTRHDQDNGKRKDKDASKRDKEKEKEKAKERDKHKVPDGRTKRPSLPATSSTTASVHPAVLHKHRSQYNLHPTSPALSPSFPSPLPSPSYRAPPPLPSRAPAPRHPSGTLRRQSMYETPNADQYYYYDEEAQHQGGSSGLLGRFLGR